MEVVTDGEMRRLSFQSELAEAVDGFGDWDLDAFLWGELARRGRRRPRRSSARGSAVRAPLRRRRHLSARSSTYRAAAHRPVAEGDAHQPRPVRDFWSTRRLDATRTRRSRSSWRASSRSCVRRSRSWRGWERRYIQLDAPHYPLLLDPR